MSLSTEEENFVKISKVVLDIVPKYLRKCFKTQWDKKFPDRKWQSDNASGEFLFELLPEKTKKDGRNKVYIKNLKDGNEEDWDTTTIVFVMLYSGLKLIEKIRPKKPWIEPLRISEAIDVIRNTRNVYFAHAKGMSCSSDVFEKVIREIIMAASCIVDDDVESEIDEIKNLEIESKLTDQQRKRVEEEESRHQDLESFLKDVVEEATDVAKGAAEFINIVHRIQEDMNSDHPEEVTGDVIVATGIFGRFLNAASGLAVGLRNQIYGHK